MNETGCAKNYPVAAPQALREPKMFNLYLESQESGFPNLTIKVSEYQLLDTIRVLSQVYFIRITE